MAIELKLGIAGNDYEEIRTLGGKAGMSDLFLAHKKGLDLDVVIKRMQQSIQSEMDEKNESEILKTLKHQYLPQIYDVIHGEDGYLYTVMDMIPGTNLQEYVEENGPINQKQAHRWACQLCEAVRYLNQEKGAKPSIIHCDIKPRNVMITKSGDICLIDFGTSLIQRQGASASAFLTLGYAAPEQHKAANEAVERGRVAEQPQNQHSGETTWPAENEELTVLAGDETVSATRSNEKTVLATENSYFAERTVMANSAVAVAAPKQIKQWITPATDVYAIGATMYFAVTGKKPEVSTQPVTPLAKHHPVLSKAMVEIFTRAMSKEPKDRFVDAGEMLRALQQVDQMDLTYRKHVATKRVAALVLSVAFIASAASTFYGFTLMKAERENTYLTILSEAEKARGEGALERGRTLLENAIQQQPTRVDAYLNLAVLLYQQGEYSLAIDTLENATNAGNLDLETLSDDACREYYYIQASCFSELENYTEALRCYQKMADKPGVTSGQNRGMAIAYAKNGQLKEAQKLLEQLRKEKASSSDCDMVAAEIAAMQGETKNALSLYHSVLKETKDQQLLSHAFLSAAQLCEQSGDLLQAAELLEQAQRELEPNRAILQKEMLAEIYSRLAVSEPEHSEEYNQLAEAQLKELIQSGIGTFATRLNLAMVQQTLREFEQAEQTLLELRENFPQDYRAEMQMAYLYIDWQSLRENEDRDYHEALEHYESAMEKYQLALANGAEDQNMVVLTNLIEQIKAGGWL